GSRLGSRSSRSTTPARGSAARAGRWNYSPFISVPCQLPAAGCTTSPAGLTSTSNCTSSCTMSIGTGSGTNAASASRGCGSTAIVSMPLRRVLPGTTWSSQRTAPSAIQRCRRVRETSGSFDATKRSSRSPAPPAASISMSDGGASASGACSGRLAIIGCMKAFVSWLRALAAIPIVSLAACCTTDGPDATLGWTPDRLYAEAKDEMASGNWAAAIKLLEKLEARYPFGRWAQQAQLDVAWVHFKDNERALSLAAIDRFMKQHPNHASLDYALYLKGLVNFNEQQGLFARFGSQDLSERDQAALRESFDAFKELLVRFPDSKYAPDAQARMRYLVNSMARGKV